MNATAWVVLLFVRATAVLLVGGLAFLLLRRASSAARHAALALTLGVLLVLPLLSGVLPGLELPVLPVAGPVQALQPPAAGDPAPVAGSLPEDAVRPGQAPVRRAKSHVTPSSATPGETGRLAVHVEEPSAGTPARPSRTPLHLPWVALVWAAGVGVGLLHTARGALLARRAFQDAEEVTGEGWTRALGDACRELGLLRPVRLLTSGAVRVPVVYGFRHPTVVLPASASGWPEGRRRAFLLHELAHVCREDWLTQMLAHVARALYWPHPLAWWLARSLRSEAERASDDRVLAAGTPAIDYADHLLLAARDLERGRQRFAVLAAVERSRFEDRLLALLDSRLRRGAPGYRALGIGALAAATLAVFVGAVHPVAQALPALPDPGAPKALAGGSAGVPAATADAPIRRAPVPASIPASERRTSAPPAVPPAAPQSGAASAPPAPLEPAPDEQPAGPDASLTPEAPPVDEAPPPIPPPAPSTTPPPAMPVIRISTDLVQIDAVVTDKNGRYVLDLRPEDLEVFEDGRRQRLTHVHYVPAGPRVPGGAPRAPGAASEPRTMMFVVDDLGLSLQSALRARRVLEGFVASHLDAQDRAAIVATSQLGKRVTVSLTSDREALAAAAAGLRYRPWGRAGLQTEAPLLAGPAGSPDTANRQWLLAIDSLNAVRRTVDSMRALPGRKAVILLSEGFSIRVSDDPERLLRHYTAMPLDSLFGDQSLHSALRALAETANRASVVVYALDPAGLQTAELPGLMGRVASAQNALSSWSGPDPGTRFNPHEALQNMRLQSFDRNARRDSLGELAAQTGGLAITDNNDLGDGLARILDDHSGYYLIGYEPQQSTFASAGRRPSYHAIQVKVKRPGLKARSRRGFYGVTDEAVAQAAPVTP